MTVIQGTELPLELILLSTTRFGGCLSWTATSTEPAVAGTVDLDIK